MRAGDDPCVEAMQRLCEELRESQIMVKVLEDEVAMVERQRDDYAADLREARYAAYSHADLLLMELVEALRMAAGAEDQLYYARERIEVLEKQQERIEVLEQEHTAALAELSGVNALLAAAWTDNYKLKAENAELREANAVIREVSDMIREVRCVGDALRKGIRRG